MTSSIILFYFVIFINFIINDKVNGNVSGLVPIIVDDCKDEVENCEGMINYCNDIYYSEFMKLNCKKTCGHCGEKAPSVDCVDRFTTGPRNCQNLEPWCKKPKYLKFMKLNCPMTCGYCTPSNTSTTVATTIDCYDLAEVDGGSDCRKNKNLCTDLKYKKFMEKQCQKTCGYCQI